MECGYDYSIDDMTECDGLCHSCAHDLATSTTEIRAAAWQSAAEAQRAADQGWFDGLVGLAATQTAPRAVPSPGEEMRIAYADPPYPGCAKLYEDHADYAGEVDHAALAHRLAAEFDGYVYHTASTALAQVLPFFPGARIMAWVKPFAAFKRNVSVAYAWEPVLIKAARKPVVRKGMIYRDWIAESITLKRGLTGAKPEKLCHWAFALVGAERGDELVDLFPGTGAVTRAWATWDPQAKKPTPGGRDDV